MQVTATHAKNRFGAICAQAKTEPVFVEKDGRVDTVILSAQQFFALREAIWRSAKPRSSPSTAPGWPSKTSASRPTVCGVTN